MRDILAKSSNKFECALGNHKSFDWITKGKSKIYCCTVCGKANLEYPILKTRTYKKWGFELRDILHDNTLYGASGFTVTRIAYTIPEGDYIGDSKTAFFLCRKKGIKPKLRCSHSKTCSIGFCEKEQKYYGWSHRAIYGFKIGDTVKKGNCAYSPPGKKEFIEESIRFWTDRNHLNIGATEIEQDGKLGVQINWTYSKKIKNKQLRSTIGGIFTPYPEKFGRGEWTAKTLEDCKQMASDFAESVS